MTFKEKVAEALKQGISPDEIKAFIKNTPEYQESAKQGLADNDVWGHLGLPADASRSTLESVGHSALATPGIIAGGITKGLTHIPGILGDVENLANAVLPESMQHQKIFPSGEDYQNMINRGGSAMGLPEGSLLGPKPENTFENYLSAGSQGVGGALPAALTGGATAAPALLASGMGGVSGELGHQMAPDSVALPLAMGLLGGAGAQAIAGGVGKLNANAALKSAQAQEALFGSNLADTQSAAERAAQFHSDLKNSLTSLRDANAQALVKQGLDHAALEANAHADAAEQIAAVHGPANEAIESAAAKLSPATTFQQAGMPAQAKVKDWLNNVMPQKVGALLDPIYSAVPDGTAATVAPLTGVFNSLNKEAGVLQPLLEEVVPNLPKVLGAKLKGIVDGQNMGLVDNATVGDLKVLRSAVGDAMADPQVLNKVGRQNLSAIYAGISQSMENTLEPLGLAGAWRSANDQVRQLYNVAERSMSQVVKSGADNGEDVSPGATASSLLTKGQKDGTVLADLRREVPEAADHLGAVALRNGLWEGLAPEAQEALIPDPGARSAINASFAAKAAATQTANDAAQAQISQSQSALNLAQQMAKQGQLNLRQQVHSAFMDKQQAKQAVDEAKRQVELASQNTLSAQNALAPPVNPMDAIAKSMKTLTSSGMGYGLGTIAHDFPPALLNALHIDPTNPALATTGALLGATLPTVGRLAGKVVANPFLLQGPALGVVGANANFPYGE